MRPKTASVNDSLWDTLVVEVEELLAEVEVFECRGPACSDLQRLLLIGYGNALLRGQHRSLTARGLVHFSAGADRHILISVPHIFPVIAVLFLVIGLTFSRH